MDPYKYRPSSSFNSPFLTTNAGAPVYNNESALTVGARGDGDREIARTSEKTSASPGMMSSQKRRREEEIGIRREGGSGSCEKENRSPATAAVRLGDRRTSRRGGPDRDSARRRTNLQRRRRRDRKISRRWESLPDTRGGSGSGAKEIESPVTAAARSENLQETRGGSAT